MTVMTTSAMKKIYILDATGFLFRSYYAITKMTNQKGDSTNALYGFIRTFQKLFTEQEITHVVAVFDGPDNKKKRSEIYADYKANRAGMPEDLITQMQHCVDYCKFMGIPTLVIPEVEADDTIGAVTKWAESKDVEVVICSADKDLCQLVTDKTTILNTYKNNQVTDQNKVLETYGILPSQIADYLAIVGDASDNIPGISGMGPKTATKLLQEFGSITGIYENIERLTNEKQKKTLLECQELAFMSKELATLFLDIPFPKEDSFFSLQKKKDEKLRELYKEMNFSTLLKELGETVITKPLVDTNYQLVNDEASFNDLLEKLRTLQEICIDTETTSLNKMDAELVGIGICFEKYNAYYIPTNGDIDLKLVLEKLKPILEKPDVCFIGHNIKYDLHILLNYGIEIRGDLFDTMIASYLVHPENNRHNLDQITLERFDFVKTSIKSLFPGKKTIAMADVPLDVISNYACEDVDYTFRLKEVLTKDLENQNLMGVFNTLEIPLLPILLQMERTGIKVDKSALEDMTTLLIKKLSILETSIYEASGETFNINSPKQLGTILFEKMELTSPLLKKGKPFSTRAEILESMVELHPIASNILEYRMLEKLRSTYASALPDMIHPQSGRIHCNFNQAVAATGRLSCQEPNLQNIPIRTEIGREIRRAFVPKSDSYSFVSADYSQIELRLLAHFSNDPNLLEAFQSDLDIHQKTASLIFHVPLHEVTKDMRSKAKAVNFGIIYGQSAFGLSKLLQIPAKEASIFIKSYFESYPKVKEYLEDSKQIVRDLGYSSTLLGRKRPIPEISSRNKMISSAAERLATNTPLQGSQADIIKAAMIKIDQILKKKNLSTSLILQVHDELIFETKDTDIEELKTIIVHEMENVVKLRIPLIVNVKIGKNWGEC